MRNVFTRMTMRLKFNDAVADRVFAKNTRKLLIPQAESNISLGRVSVSIKAYERVVQRLAEMSLEELLYHALAGEGTRNDEPA
jgi:hypothetical protein